jgi:hypothetical protein
MSRQASSARVRQDGDHDVACFTSLFLPVPRHTRSDTSRSMISLATALLTLRRIGFRASPCGAVRPLRAWLVGIALLWSVLWRQLAIDHGTFGTVVAISLFAIACALTVLYGMRSYVDRSGRVTRYPTRSTDLETPK